MQTNWSEFQKEIFKNIKTDNGHLIVEALAGSGKTSTLVESFKHVPSGKKILATAFNKIIQKELRERSGSYVDCYTFHSLGFSAVKKRFGNVKLDESKCFNIVKDLVPSNTDYDLIKNITDTVTHAKNALIDTPSKISDLIFKFGIDCCEMSIKDFTAIVAQTLRKCKEQTSVIDFNDMCWFPFVYNLNVGQYDYVYVDEFQDLNKSQLVMAKKACKQDAKLIFFGDPYQAIYSWLGADNSIIEDIKKIPTTKILTLPISYRCPKKVIDLCKSWTKNISCPDDKIDGEINKISLNELFTKVKPGCFILSRTNAPLIKICMSLIKLNIKANIKGRDVGKQLGYLIKKSKKKKIPAFLTWLESWKKKEVEVLESKKFNTDNVLDCYECLCNLAEESSSVDDLLNKCEELFNDDDQKNIVMLSSVHRAKGLETDDVFLLRWTFRVWLDNLSLVNSPNEEANIAYVGASRAKQRLFLVNKI